MSIPFLRGLCALAILSALTAPARADILAVQTFGGRVVRMDELTGQPVPGWEILAGAVEVEPGMFPVLLSGVAVSEDIVYVSSNTTGHILQFDLNTGAPIGDGVFAKLPDNMLGTAGPGVIKVGPSGDIYVADNGGTDVHRYAPSGDYLGPFVEGSEHGIAQVGGIAFRDDGAMLIAGFGDRGVYLSDGESVETLVNPEQSPMFAPNAELANSDDSFLVVDLGGDAVHSFSQDGMTSNLFADIPMPEDVDPENPPPAALPSPLGGLNSFPSDLLATPEGDVLVSTLGVSSTAQGASKNYGALLRYDQSGTLLETLASDLTPIGAITLAPGLVTTPGDSDGDGEVTVADYGPWQESYGRQVTAFSGADANGDGLVDARDYTSWRDNLQPTAPAGSSIPEPASLALVALSWAGLASRRR